MKDYIILALLMLTIALGRVIYFEHNKPTPFDGSCSEFLLWEKFEKFDRVKTQILLPQEYQSQTIEIIDNFVYITYYENDIEISEAWIKN